MFFLKKSSVAILLYMIIPSICQYKNLYAHYKPGKKNLNNEIHQLNEELKANKEEISNLSEQIKDFKKIIDIKNFMVVNTEEIPNNQLEEYLIHDINSILHMEIKLFYSMGKIHGYVVFVNNENDHAIINNAKLKLTFISKYFISGRKTFYINISKEKFKKIYIERGDIVIAFPIKRINYRKVLPYRKSLPRGASIQVKAECFQLKTRRYSAHKLEYKPYLASPEPAHID